MKLNGGRLVTGILRGFDPFMNLVVDEAVEETKGGEKHNIGMIVSFLMRFLTTSFFTRLLNQLVLTSRHKRTCSEMITFWLPCIGTQY